MKKVMDETLRDMEGRKGRKGRKLTKRDRIEISVATQSHSVKFSVNKSYEMEEFGLDTNIANSWNVGLATLEHGTKVKQPLSYT